MIASFQKRWLFALTAAALSAVTFACGDSPPADVTAAPTEPANETTATATATTEPATTDIPAIPPVPALPAGATEIANGTLQLQIPAAGIAEVDPVDVAVEQVGAAPPCAGFIANWAWGSEPANDDLVVTAVRQGGGSVVGEGATGSTTGGCLLMRFANNSAQQVTVTVDYLLGDISQ